MHPENRPIIILVQKTGDLYAPTLIGDDTTTPDNRPPLHVRGEAGQLLYMALAGHRFGASPDEAHQLVATQARAFIQAFANKSLNERLEFADHADYQPGSLIAMVEQEKQFNLAHRVVEHWGLFIRPFLGYFYTDDAGQIIPHHPDYEKVIFLPTPQTWGQFNLMMS